MRWTSAASLLPALALAGCETGGGSGSCALGRYPRYVFFQGKPNWRRRDFPPEVRELLNR